MPIYEYRCSSCGVRKEHLQKISDPRLTTCPECGKETYEKQLTAAGFQLKGSGWYVTDFRNGSTASSGKDAGAKDSTAKTGESDAAKDGGSADSGAKETAGKDGGGKDSTAGSSAAPAAAPASSAPSSGADS